MQALAVDEGRHATHLTRRDPFPPAADEVVVEIHACGICGSDLRSLAAGSMSTGTVLGHEAAGVVVETGDAVGDRSRGDRVAINPFSPCGRCAECAGGLEHLCPEALRSFMGGGSLPGAFAELVTVPAATTMRLPDDLRIEDAALAEPLAVAIHALRLDGVDLSRPIAVLGAGPIGLLTALVARDLGTGPIVVLSRNPARADRARALGLATASSDETKAGTAFGEPGVWPATVAECAGTAEALDLAVAMARPRGQVIAVGVTKGAVAFRQRLLVLKEAVVRGAFAYNRSDFELAIEMLAAGTVPAARLVTLDAPLADGPEIIASLGRGGSAHVKVLLDPRR